MNEKLLKLFCIVIAWIGIFSFNEEDFDLSGSIATKLVYPDLRAFEKFFVFIKYVYTICYYPVHFQLTYLYRMFIEIQTSNMRNFRYSLDKSYCIILSFIQNYFFCCSWYVIAICRYILCNIYAWLDSKLVC